MTSLIRKYFMTLMLQLDMKIEKPLRMNNDKF